MQPPSLPVRLLSIIVPVYEQWHLVPRLVSALASQTVPREAFTLIVVDNGSTTQPVPDSVPGIDELVRCTTPGSYAARNFGVTLAQTPFLAFTDADCVPDQDWVESILAALAGNAEGLIYAGDVLNRPAAEPPNVFEIYDMVKGFPVADYAKRSYGITANLAFSRALFDAAGGFDARRYSGGDAEFCRRAVAKGARVIHLPTARVQHPARRTWRELATKARRIKGAQLLHGSIGRRALYFLRTLLPPLREYGRLVTSPAHGLVHRCVALGVQTGLWIVEIAEALRVLAGGKPERS